MLHGEMDHHVEKHEKLELVTAFDFDHWMCNLYFEIVKLPRFLAGQKEYEVELQFSPVILAYPDRDNTDETRHDGEDHVSVSLSHLHTDTTANTSKIAPDATVGSSVSILIIDYNLKRYENQTGTYPMADGAKLYWHFYHVESTGLAGIFIMLFIYVFTCFMACALLCMMSQHNCTARYRPYYGTPMTKQSIVINGPYMQCIFSVDVDMWSSVLNWRPFNFKYILL